MHLFFFLSIAFFLWCLSILGEMSWVLNVFFVIVWFLVLITLVKSKNKESVLNVIMIYSMTMGIICCLIVEGGAYLSEIRMVGKLSGASIRVGFSALAFIFGAVMFCALMNNNLQPVKTIDRRVNSTVDMAIQLIMIGSFIGLFFVYVKYGTPNSNGVDRFEYWDGIAPTWGRYLQFMLLQFSFLLGIKYIDGNKKRYLLLLISSICMQFIGGEKFTGPSLSILFFLMPVLYNAKNDVLSLIVKPRFLLLLMLVVSIFFISTYMSYAAIYGNPSEGIRYLSERIALQAQVWWAVDSVSELINPDLNMGWLLQNAFGQGVGEDKVVFGMYYLMQQITPTDVFLRFLDNGVRFTMGAPVNYNYFFGSVLGPVVALIFGALAGFGAWLIRNAIVMRDLFFSFIIIKYYYFIIQICIMSDWYYVFSMKFWAFTIFIAFYSLVLQGINVKKCTTV